MEEPSQVWFIVAVVVVGIGGAIWRYFDQKRDDSERARALTFVAGSRGWRYIGRDKQVRKELGLPFGWGSVWLDHIIRGGIEGTDFIAYDQVTEQKNNRFRVHVAAFRMRPGFPRFRVLPNTYKMMLERYMTWSKVEFPEDPPFEKAFRVEAPDAGEAKTAFEERIRGYLSANPGWRVDSDKEWVRISDDTRDGPAEDVEPFQAKAWELAKLFKSR